ncbi:MAG: biopolymer transporter ExbD [Verrucomicrobia bacterium]|nr:biopolymer transporter ExbD [Verrucomicrobiota bacterium]
MRRRRHSLTSGHSTLSEINVTPLLDLCFVLLVIFMITTPLLESSTDLIVPTSKASRNAVDPAKISTLAIDRNERLTLNGEAVTAETLPARLIELVRTKPDAAVVIRPHKDLPVQRLMTLLDALKAAGITKVGVLAATEA